MVENIAGKGENAGFQHFLLFSQYFHKASFFLRGWCGKGLKVALQIWDDNFTKVLKNHPYIPKAF